MRSTTTALLVVLAALLGLANTAVADSFCGNPVNPPPAPDNDPPQCQPQCPTCSASPCYAGSGAYVTQTTDLSVPIVGGAITVTRSYTSTRLIDGIFGVGQSSILHSRLYYARYLFAAPSTYQNVADVVMPDGKHYRFVEREVGQFTPPPTRSDILVRTADGAFDLHLQQSRTIYHYGPDGSLTTIADDAGNVTSFTRDGSGRISRIADSGGSGRYVDVYWGADGRIASLRDSALRTVSYAYNTNGSLATVTDPAGRTTTYTYVIGRFQTPLLSRVTDHWGRIITEITYLPTDQVESYSENGEVWRMTYRYDNDPKVTAKKDSADNLWRMRFGSDIQITERIAPDNSATQTVYSPEGWIMEQTDQVGVRTTHSYDVAGKVTSVVRNAGSASAVRYEYAYDSSFAEKVASVTPRDPATNTVDPDWQAWRYDYHPAGSPSPGALFHVYRVQSDGSTLDTVATYEYDTAGKVTRQTSATGAQTDYSYDATGNLHQVTAPANNDAGTRPQTTYAYDAMGRVLSVTDPRGMATVYTYDAMGRVLTVTLPKPTAGSNLNFTTTYSYDHWDASSGLVLTHVTDPNGKLTKLGYDQYGRLVKSIDAAGMTTAYAYTKDVLTSITDANGNVTQYAYDALRRLQTTTFPDGATETYTYWPDGLLETKGDRRGTVTTYAYDAFKRLTLKSYSTGGSVSYSYDGQGLTEIVDSTTNPSETHSFTYDPSYRLATAVQGPRGTVSYQYTPDDRPAQMDLPGGVTAAYAYYSDGSLKTTDWSPVLGQFRWSYNRAGQYDQLMLPNGQIRDYSYDDQGRLVELANVLGNAALPTFGYGYDVDNNSGAPGMLGQRTSRTERSSGSLIGKRPSPSYFLYDALYQLVGENVSPTVYRWTYDSIGNRTGASAGGSNNAYTYFRNGSNPLNGQRLQCDGTSTWTYDSAGNALTQQSSSLSLGFEYDVENRTSAISGSVSAAYAYDYQGRRTSKTVGGVTTTYLYDGLNLVAETTNGQTSHFLNGPGIDEPLAMAKSGGVSYFSVDALGSVVTTSNPAGVVTHSVRYDPWGKVRTETGARTHPFTYTGREVGEAGFHFYRARFYQPSIGRFSQEDPIRFAAIEPSAYRYAFSNPMAFVDPSGMTPCSFICDVSGGGGCYWALRAGPEGIVPTLVCTAGVHFFCKWFCDVVPPFFPPLFPPMPPINPGPGPKPKPVPLPNMCPKPTPPPGLPDDGPMAGPRPVPVPTPLSSSPPVPLPPVPVLPVTPIPSLG